MISYINRIGKRLLLMDSYLNISQPFVTCLFPSSTLNALNPGFVILHFESNSFPSLLILLAINLHPSKSRSIETSFISLICKILNVF